MTTAVIGPVSRWHDSGIGGAGPGLWYGHTALDGAFGDWKRAPLGSIYIRVDTSGIATGTWQKTARNGATTDWRKLATNDAYYNVDAYGAVAGGGDSYAAFAAAIAAASVTGGVVLVPSGTYRVDGRLTLSDNVSLVGTGSDSIIQRTDVAANGSDYIVFVEDASNVYIADLELDGGITSTWDGSAFIGIAITTNVGTTDNVRIMRVTVKGVDVGMRVAGSATNVIVADCYFDDSFFTGVECGFSHATLGPSNVRIRNNLIDSPVGTGIYLAGTSYDVHVDGNTIKSAAGNGIQSYIATGQTRTVARALILNNTILDQQNEILHGIYLINNAGSGGSGTMSGLIIGGNVIRNSAGGGIYTLDVKESRIVDNYIQTTGNSLHGISVGKNVVDPEHVVIAHNIIQSPSGYGIKCESVHYGVIAGNIVDAAGGHGIDISGNYWSCVGNTAHDSGGYGYNLTGNTNSMIVGNNGSNNSSGDFNLAGFYSLAQTSTAMTLGDAYNMVFNATTGTKLGTATTQKIGFWNATPIVQPVHIADPAGGATVDAEARSAIASINATLAALGLTAAS